MCNNMSVNWTNELEMSFLDNYQAEPVLWDTTLKDYKNKYKTKDAWSRISAIMDIPVEELKSKRVSLLASYRSYKNKVKRSIQSGADADEVYTPIWFAYEVMDSFLGDNTKCKNRINTVRQSTNSRIDSEQTQMDLEEEMGNQSQYVKAAPRIRRRKNPSEVSEVGKVIKEAIAMFKTTIKTNELQTQLNRSTREEDDCDLYGKLLASKLRKLPEEKKLRLMHDIDGMFLCPQNIVYLESPSPITSPSPQLQYYINRSDEE